MTLTLQTLENRGDYKKSILTLLLLFDDVLTWCTPDNEILTNIMKIIFNRKPYSLKSTTEAMPSAIFQIFELPVAPLS